MNLTTNEISIPDIKKCLPQRAQVTVRKPFKGSSAHSIEVFCDPAMKDNETQYVFESIKQVIPVKEFYSEEQGRHFFIYPKYDKNLPLSFTF